MPITETRGVVPPTRDAGRPAAEGLVGPARRGSALPSIARRYAVAALAVAAVVAFRLAAWLLVRDDIPWIPYAPAIIFAAWYGGIGPGLAATLLSALATDYFLLPPYRSLGPTTPDQWIGVVIFLVTGALICLLVERMRAARDGLRAANEGLERRVAERTAEVVEKSRTLDAFLSHSLTPLVLLDRDFNFIRVNQAYAVACQRKVEDFPGHNHFEFYPSDAQAIFEEVVRTKQPFKVTARRFSFPDHPEWGVTYWDWTLTPLLDAAGEVEVLVFALEDVTARRRAEMDLEDYREYLEELVQQRTEQLQAANEKLQAQTEELLANNEEMQTQQEELEASNEELQAQREELEATVAQVREAQERLLASEERERERAEEARAIVENASVAIWIARDPECREIIGNAYADEIIMHSARGGNISRSATPGEAAVTYQVFRDGAELRPEDLPAQRAAATGNLVPAFEMELLFPNGRRLTLLAGAVPLFDSKGSVRGAVVAGVDITEQVRVQEALRESEARLNHAQQIADVGSWEWDIETGALLWSAQTYRQMGEEPGQLQPGYEAFRQRVHPDDRKAFDAAIEGALAGRSPYDIELRIVRPGGDVRVLHSRGEILPGPRGHPRRMVGVSLDITLRKQAEEALRQANKELREADRQKDQFLAMLGHELRNPLAAIVNAVRLMEARGLDDPLLERAREAAARQAEHMARLLDDLLDVARVTQGKIALKQEGIDLRAVVESAVDAVRPLIGSRAQTLHLGTLEAGIKMRGDMVRLVQVVSNLLNNASKYTQPGGEIRLLLEGFDDKALIHVRDNGAGIAADLLPHVFDIFVQGERTLGRTEGGLGVGLTLARTLVELHGGCIEAHSAGPGEGSEFVVYLPLLGGLRVQGSRESGPNPEPRTLSPARRILLVEDNADSAEMLALLLEGEGHEVVVAHDGPTALDLAGNYRPDLVLLDLGLPGMDGYTVAERLLQTPGFGKTPLVAITGYGQDEDVERSAQCGFACHLVKPVDTHSLLRLLATSTFLNRGE